MSDQHLHRTGLDAEQTWWLAQEMRNTADAIGAVPDLAEKSLRALADKVEKGEIEAWGGL